MRFRRFIPFFIIISSLIILACGSPEEKRIKFFNKGKALYEKGEYVKARLEFKNALQIDPKFAEGYHMLGMAELREKNWRRAFGSLNKAVELDPDLLDAEVALGRILLAAGESKKIPPTRRTNRPASDQRAAISCPLQADP